MSISSISKPLSTRRNFLKGTAGAAIPLGFPAIGAGRKKPTKIMVMAVDGMDPRLTRKLINEGRLPNCSKLAAAGEFQPMGTTYPPQSPVAWSSFISGTDPGGHGIFDFIARDPLTRTPFLSTAKTEDSGPSITVGDYSFPLGGGKTTLLREGLSLWDILAEAGMNSLAFRAPVNFPAPESGARTLSGITTPDIQGSYGIFTWITTDVAANPGEVAGGTIRRVAESDGIIQFDLEGPLDPVSGGKKRSGVPVKVSRDKVNLTALFEVDGQRFLLAEKEWSDWIRVEFPLTGSFTGIASICRFCLKEAGEVFSLYVSPFNIDPSRPVADISFPRSYAGELSEEFGLFYTQGMPEDTAALSSGVFDDDDFLEQSLFVLEENLRLLEHELNRFDEGFFYFYFSSLDLNSHVFWRAIDPAHPLHTPELAEKFGDVLPSLYARIDEGIGRAMEHIDEDTVFMVVSDHGFVPFRRQFNLNSWLVENDYASLRNRFDREESGFFSNTRWTETRAYGLGINSLYLNVAGREDEGAVAPGDEFETTRETLIRQLTGIKDPENGQQVIRGVYRPEDLYTGPCLDRAPDLIVCYNQNYRASWDTILGSYPRGVLLDNLDPWSGDHCMHPEFLSGVFICNRPTGSVGSLQLWDLAPSILSVLDLPVPSSMTGKKLWS